MLTQSNHNVCKQQASHHYEPKYVFFLFKLLGLSLVYLHCLQVKDLFLSFKSSLGWLAKLSVSTFMFFQARNLLSGVD